MNIELLVVFIMAIIGLIFTFFRNRKFVILTAIAALTGFVFLLIFNNNLDIQVQSSKQFMAIVEVHYKIGYWLCLLSLLFALIVETLFLITQIVKPGKPAQPSAPEITQEGQPLS